DPRSGLHGARRNDHSGRAERARRDRGGDVPRPIDPVGQRFDLRDCEVRLQIDRPPRSRAQHEMGLDALHAPEDLQKADAVDRTGRTRNPHDDLLHGRSILETPHCVVISWPANDVRGSWRSVTTVPSPRRIAIRSGVNSVCQSGSPNSATEERSSWSETVIRRGSWSCVRFFMPQKAPPETIVASTRLNLRQRSSPPWASTILASRLFMVSLLMVGSS